MNAQRYREIPPTFRLISAVPTYFHAQQLPINLLLLIISYIDDIGDLARFTRVSRLTYYLAIPRLYEHVTLRAYSSLRYVNDHPEGFGGGSPFATGLDALISSPNNVGQYLKSLTLCGSWKETDVEEFSKGRVPDNTMILNVSIKASIARATNLENFSWELNTKPMKTIYQGLATRNSLTCLKIRFTSSRLPRPTIVIPAMPRLRKLHLENLDPLCYNDDPSLLIAEASTLETLKMHWSPRIRRERELSVSMVNYFGRVLSLKRTLRLKEIAFANLFSRNDINLDNETLDLGCLESMTTVNCMNRDDPHTIFVDKTWESQTKRAVDMTSIKRLRTDTIHESTIKTLFIMRGLEEMYLISNRQWKTSKLQNQTQDGESDSPETRNMNGDRAILGDSVNASPDSGSNSAAHESNDLLSPTAEPPPFITKRTIALASDCVVAITKIHGATLRKLLLFDTWSLGGEAMINLLSSCPNLRQVGLAADFGHPEFPQFMQKCLRAAPKLQALRILIPPWSGQIKEAIVEGKQLHMELMSHEMAKEDYANLRWLAIGSIVLELGEMENGRRKVKEVPWDDERLSRIEIFGLDNGEI